MKMSAGEGRALWFNKDCQCVRLIRNKMHTVSLFGHFESWDRVAFKRAGYSKDIQNDSNQIQTRLQTLPSSRPPSPLDSLSLSFSIWDSRTWWKVISFNGILRKPLLGICYPCTWKRANVLTKRRIMLSPCLELEPVGVRRLAHSLSAPFQSTPSFSRARCCW